MKLSECIEMGIECGLNTLDECIKNVEIHAPSLFAYDHMAEELNELYSDLEEKEPEYFHSRYVKNDMSHK